MPHSLPPTQDDVKAAREIVCFDNGLEASGWRDSFYLCEDDGYIHLHERMNDWDFSVEKNLAWLTEDEANAKIQRLKEEREKWERLRN